MLDFVNKRLKNNVYLGLCFVVLFSSFNALINVQKTITTSIQLDDPNYTADGYTSLGIVYTTFSIFMWFSPAVIAKLGSKYTMILGACFYGFFMATFYTENNAWVYFGSALCGIGASLLWTGQGNYIVLNAEIGKVYSGIGIFWIIFQASHFFGNLIVYLEFNDINRAIDKPLRRRIVTMFVGFVAIGVLMMLGIKAPIRKEENETKRKPSAEVVKSIKMLLSPHMLLLCITMICLGIHLTFLSVLSASMGFSKYLSDNSKELAPLCGLLHGCGEIIGGILSITLGGRTICKTKPLLTLACALNIIAYTISLLALPTNSANFYTNDSPIIVLPTAFLLAAAIFVGVGDACFHTELYDYIGAKYPNDSAPAIAIFKFIASLATASSFYYSKILNLHTQIIILLLLTVLSWISYHYMQWFMLKSPTTASTTEQTEKKEIDHL